jgi:hypothetical protein
MYDKTFVENLIYFISPIVKRQGREEDYLSRIQWYRRVSLAAYACVLQIRARHHEEV